MEKEPPRVIPIAIWFTGLSGSGKSTIANILKTLLEKRGINVPILDGDIVRNGLCKDLDFSEEGRNENIRRIAEVAKILIDSGLVVIVSTISPADSHRQNARQLVGYDKFYLVFIDCPLTICEKRDPKTLYKKARCGELTNFTGIDSIYQIPDNPDIIIKTESMSPNECVELILKDLLAKRILLD